MYMQGKFCDYFRECQYGNECNRAFTDNIRATANALKIKVALFAEMPECFRGDPKKGRQE